MSPIRLLAIGSLILSLLCPSIALSGEWRVAPIRLDFGREAKSGVITVVNEAAEKLQVQLKAFEWSQDAEGKDQYSETNDILFFPRILVFDKAEEKIVRAGIRMPAVAREKAYRLFIEEIPVPKKAEGVNVAIAIRFGVPIFVKPIKEEARGEIEKIEMTKGTLNARVKNTGNLHFIVRSVGVKGKNLKGEETFSKEIGGWYLLAGASRLYETTLPREACPETARAIVEVATDKVPLHGEIAVDKTMCAP
ncbi:MAG: molecular chaperone [Deltaproteobacteria bacterium]|nr:molecular chaperone [Deltaproteobacteria bacterium]